MEVQHITGVSKAELQTLADIHLSVEAQAQLSHLLAQNKDSQLSDLEEEKLNHLLSQVDDLNLLKARAHYTLKLLNVPISHI